MKSAVQTSRFQYLVWTTLIVSFLIVMIGCGGPTFTAIPRSEIPDSDQIRLYLTVSDTLFPGSIIEQYYQAGYDGIEAYDRFLEKRVGPQLYVWARCTGPSIYMPVRFTPWEMKGEATWGVSIPAKVKYTIDGEEPVPNKLGGVGYGPCHGFEHKLRYVESGESFPFPVPIDALNAIDFLDRKPGVYEVSIVLESICSCDEDERPIWIGRAQSNTVSFRIAE